MIKKTPPLDRDKVKIASFRITEGEWFDFTEAADRQNITATDVIKGAIQLFMDGLLELPDLNYVSTAINTSASVDGGEIQTLIDSAIEQALTPIKELLSTARVGTHTDLTADGVQTAIDAAIERAIAPISIDLAELLGQVDELRGNLNGVKASGTKSKATRTPTTTTEEPHNEVIKVAARLEKEPALKAAVIDALSHGHIGERLGEYLAGKGFLNKNGMKYTGASNSRFKMAIEYLNQNQ
jgi:hypothetical protein